MLPQLEKKFMRPNKNLSIEENAAIPDEMERAKYWTDLLYKAVDKYDIYILAKHNLDSTNRNSIKQEKARKILEEAIKRYEEIYKS
jgi:hypothetical protein